MEQIINITNLRKDIYKISDSVINDGVVMNVSCKAGNMVMISKEEYDALIETLYLSSNAQYKESLLEGKKLKDEDLIDEKDIDW